VHVSSWMTRLSGTGRAADYFLQQDRFPLLPLPVWLERSIRGRANPKLQRELVYSGINGYYFVRLLDNVMDGHDTLERKLLPAAAVFHAEFHGAYQRLFVSDHAFWHEFRRTWFAAAETLVRETTLEAVDERAFDEICARKMDAVHIPLAAVCHLHGRLDLLPRWSQFCRRLGAFEQFQDDVFDWHRDASSGQRSFFLSEAERRRRPNESRSQWVVRQGFGWGVDRALARIGALRRAARALGSVEAGRHVERRAAHLARRRAALTPALRALAKVAAALDQTSPSIDSRGVKGEY
jgi:hypothetical protein